MKKYSRLETFYYSNRTTLIVLTIGILFMVLIYWSCNRSSSSLYEVMFKSPPPQSVNFRNSQDCYIMDCCLWLHFNIDSSDLNKLLKDGFKEQKVDFDFANVPPEAKDWWHPETLGNNA